MFYDEARIYIRSGDGGNGAINFRREKYVPLGGPDGGDGGQGGDVTFVVNPRLNSLTPFHKKVHFRAGNGGRGDRQNMTGANGESLRLDVPPGTVIRDAETGELLADLTEAGQEVTLLKGGRGGRGNARFATSVHQAPRMAEKGEPGQEKWLTLELKLIADVGIIGVPNAGKSTLLSVVSAARPKIAAYPFTTLQPNLGVAHLDDYQTMVLADIPGLIGGAAAGAGLGHDFLRHVERTRVLIHLLDGASEDPRRDWAIVNQELALYDVSLSHKPQVVVLNKMDLPQAQAWEARLKQQMAQAGYPFLAISAVTHEGVRPLLYQVKRMVDEAPPPELATREMVVIRPAADEDAFTIERDDDGWRVRGVRIERVAAMTYWGVDEAAERFQRILEKMGITQALEAAGVQDGDTVYIGEEELEWGEPGTSG